MRDGHLHQVDAGRLERLDEARSPTPSATTFLLHDFEAPPRSGSAARRGAASGAPSRLAMSSAVAFVLAHELAREHVAVADPVLQRDAPLPARGARRGARVRREHGARGGAGHRHRAVARQPVRPVLEAALERALDQQRAKTRAVDEQPARSPPGPTASVTDSTKPSPARCCTLGDAALDALDAALLVAYLRR